ncbi:NAD(P)-dependent oxidoreductase [Coraliomargarita sp. SDUM461004]|uniref:NAD(P)-dependent oxidoreductase n=1 Tax=Thalassobacterium sedimentorum TaxID=3041258 RepID=A0ABU1AGA9_9BACT|nr:NAD(P)-dependent oxidoreductase [Coraliomargarita sp. SDUM461004]MDQ8193871.1 NAD(P)-dependent oxidoreductase [Coraliomargarita sp. SDUM461004]
MRTFKLDATRITTWWDNWGHSISRYVAECAMSLSLATLRNIGTHQHAMRENKPWRFEHMPEVSLFGRKVGLHGFGAISREFLKLLQPYGAKCRAWDPFVSHSEMSELGVQAAASLEDLYANCDVLVVFCALTHQTRKIINADLLNRLPDQATFINVARGELVDESALIKRLKSGKLRAGLDVFTKEPLPGDSDLRKLPNVVLTPHLGGFTTESRAHALAHSIENIRRYAANEPLLSEISLELYDRMT